MRPQKVSQIVIVLSVTRSSSSSSISSSSNMRLAYSLALVFVAISLMAHAAARALDPVASRHDMKLTYCQEQRSKRVFRTENLEDLCTLKVAFFDDQVHLRKRFLVVLKGHEKDFGNLEAN